jgi:hypothetical protein
MYRSHAGGMGPVSLVACHRQMLGLSLLLHWLAWERKWVWTHGSVNRHAIDCVGNPFSREQWDPSKSVDESLKVATYGTAHRNRMPRIRRLVCEAYVLC